MARGGGGGGARGGGGFGGGGFHGGGGFGGGGFHGGGGFVGGGFRGGTFGNFGFGRFGFGFRGFRGFYGGYWPGYWGWGWGYPGSAFAWGWPSYGSSCDPYYGCAGAYPYGYPDSYAGYANYQPSPNVTVVYPPPTDAPAAAGPAVIHQYDEYGQEVPSAPGITPPAASTARETIFLIAFNGTSVIYAAVAYWVDQGNLHYVTLDHQEREAPLNTVNRSLSVQLNWERHVAFQLPAQ